MYKLLLSKSKDLYKYLNQNPMFRKGFRFLFLNYCRVHLYLFVPIIRMMR